MLGAVVCPAQWIMHGMGKLKFDNRGPEVMDFLQYRAHHCSKATSRQFGLRIDT